MDGQGAGVLCGVNPPADTNSLGTGKGYRCTDPITDGAPCLGFHPLSPGRRHESIENAWQIHHCRDVKFPRHDGAMGKVAARLHDQRARLEE